MKSVTCAVFVLAASPLSDAGVVGRAVSSIEPELEPETHKEWEKDYPIDVSHRTKLDTKFPYPKVQESDDFDKDYVKDENNNKMDKKAWDEQLKYAKAISDAAEEVDKLKNKLNDLEKALDDAKKKDAEEGKEYEDAKKKEEELGDGPKDFEGKDLDKVTGEAVKVSTDEVEKEISDLEECKKQLKEAKEKLAKLNEEAEAAHLSEEKAEAVKVDAVNFEKVAEEKHDMAKKALEHEEEDYDKAKKSHDEEKAELAKMEEELKKAEEKLRSFRGGAQEAPNQSGAPSVRAAVLASAVVITSLLYTSTA